MIFTSLEGRAQGPKVHSIEEEDQKRKKHKKHTFCPFCHFFRNFTKMAIFGPPKSLEWPKSAKNRSGLTRSGENPLKLDFPRFEGLYCRASFLFPLQKDPSLRPKIHFWRDPPKGPFWDPRRPQNRTFGPSRPPKGPKMTIFGDFFALFFSPLFSIFFFQTTPTLKDLSEQSKLGRRPKTPKKGTFWAFFVIFNLLKWKKQK